MNKFPTTSWGTPLWRRSLRRNRWSTSLKCSWTELSLTKQWLNSSSITSNSWTTLPSKLELLQMKERPTVLKTTSARLCLQPETSKSSNTFTAQVPIATSSRCWFKTSSRSTQGIPTPSKMPIDSKLATPFPSLMCLSSGTWYRMTPRRGSIIPCNLS